MYQCSVMQEVANEPAQSESVSDQRSKNARHTDNGGESAAVSRLALGVVGVVAAALLHRL